MEKFRVAPFFIPTVKYVVCACVAFSYVPEIRLTKPF